MSKIIYILLTILIMSLLVIIHEFGHFITARRCGVTIHEFSIGMGPVIFTKKSKKTGIAYSVRLFLIGGYVAMEGENENSDDPNAFCFKPLWQRMLITCAGAFMNIAVGFILMLAVVLSSANIGGTTILRFVDDNSLSRQSGLQVGDEIIRVGDARVHVASELAYEIMRWGTEPVDITVRRNSEIVKVENVKFPTIVEEGISFGMTDFIVRAQEKNVQNVLTQTYYRSVSTVKMIWQSLFDLVTGHYGVEQISGPVGVTSAVSEAARSGSSNLLYLIVVITMNLGIFNLLPLPALDGGRLLFQIIELIRRKPVKAELEGYVHFAGIVILMIFMAIVTFKDVMKLIG